MKALRRLREHKPVIDVVGRIHLKRKNDKRKSTKKEKIATQKLIDDIIRKHSEDDDFCTCVRQVTKNYLKNDSWKSLLDKADIGTLNKQERNIRGVLHKDKEVSRRYIKQSGGFLPILAAPIVGFIIKEVVDAVIDHVLPEDDNQ